MKFLSFSIISLRFGVDKDIGACQGSNSWRSDLELELLPLKDISTLSNLAYINYSKTAQKSNLFNTLLELVSLRPVLAYNKFVYINFQFVKVEIVIFSVQKSNPLALNLCRESGVKIIHNQLLAYFPSNCRHISANVNFTKVSRIDS